MMKTVSKSTKNESKGQWVSSYLVTSISLTKRSGSLWKAIQFAVSTSVFDSVLLIRLQWENIWINKSNRILEKSCVHFNLVVSNGSFEMGISRWGDGSVESPKSTVPDPEHKRKWWKSSCCWWWPAVSPLMLWVFPSWIQMSLGLECRNVNEFYDL